MLIQALHISYTGCFWLIKLCSRGCGKINKQTYIHAYIHTCIHTYIHTYKQTYTHTLWKTIAVNQAHVHSQPGGRLWARTWFKNSRAGYRACDPICHIIDYCDVPTNVGNLQRLQRLHSRFSSYDLTSSSLFNLECRRFHTAIQIYKILKSLSPS